MAEVLEDYIKSGDTDPTTSTVGTLGQFYRNRTKHTYFKCTAINTSTNTYTWKPSVLNLHYEKQ